MAIAIHGTCHNIIKPGVNSLIILVHPIGPTPLLPCICMHSITLIGEDEAFEQKQEDSDQ